MSTEWASVDSTADGWQLRFERRLKQTPEKVWRAITEPDELAHWFPARMEGDRAAGAELRFEFEDAPMPVTVQAGRVITCEPPRVFEFEWDDDVLRFELRPDGEGCLLVFTHLLSEANGGRLAAGRNAAGWDQCLAALEASLDGSQVPEAEMLPRIQAYIERFGLGEPQVDGDVLRFERDIVWQPLLDAWRALVGSEAGYLEPGATVPESAAPAAARGVITHVEPERVLEFETPAGPARWELAADPRLGHRVLVIVPGTQLRDAWKQQIDDYFVRLLSG